MHVEELEAGAELPAAPRKLTGKELKRRKKENARRRERYRVNRLLEYEDELWSQGLQYIAGVDEAGRGPLAGPVFAAAVIMPPGVAISGVDDSKKLTPEARLVLAVKIRERALALGVGAASSREVDRINILRATHLAMCRAVARLRIAPERIIVDGLPVASLGSRHTAIVDGDEKVHGIACASIIAKTMRDLLMTRLSGRYPGYGWDHNVGYGTPEHREAIDALGMTPHHRRSFANLQLAFDFSIDMFD
jgi:ribonuclease HII